MRHSCPATWIQRARSAQAPPVAPVSPEIPLAVIPFAYQQSGIFSTDRCTLVVYPDQVVIAYVSKASEDEFDQATTEVEALLMEKHLEGKNLWQVAAGAGFALFRLAWSPVDFYSGGQGTGAENAPEYYHPDPSMGTVPFHGTCSSPCRRRQEQVHAKGVNIVYQGRKRSGNQHGPGPYRFICRCNENIF